MMGTDEVTRPKKGKGIFYAYMRLLSRKGMGHVRFQMISALQKKRAHV
jgi:hypothetical protein